MQLLKDIDDLIFEKANLTPFQTGIKDGIIWISTQETSHGCRIKYFSNIRKQSESLIISIPDCLIVNDTLKNQITDLKRKEVILFANKNKDKLLNFWNNGRYWTDPEVDSFKKTLKLKSSDFKDLKNIQIKYK
jgi:hypothetical protein